jgi:hypothetical protein
MNEEEFYNNAEKWLQADKSKWTHVTLLAHFCKKYEEINGIKFRLVRSRKGPTMGKEAADFAKLFRTLAPENYKMLDKEAKKVIRYKTNIKVFNYINWMFDYKFRRGQQSVNGTRLFLIPSLIVEFERMYSDYLSKKSIENNFEKLLSWCKAEAKEIFDTHQLTREDDIKMIKRYAEMYQLDDLSVEKRVLAKACEVGLL